MSTEACVCCRPSSPDSQHPIDGICRLLVQVLTSTAAISSALIGDQEKLAFLITSALLQTCSPRTMASASSLGWTANASRTRTGGYGAAGSTASGLATRGCSEAV